MRVSLHRTPVDWLMHGLLSNFHPSVASRLQSIVCFISKDSPARASLFGNALIDTALMLESSPEMGRDVPELDNASVREIIHGSCRITYEFHQSSDTACVLRFGMLHEGYPRSFRSDVIVRKQFPLRSLRLLGNSGWELLRCRLTALKQSLYVLPPRGKISL